MATAKASCNALSAITELTNGSIALPDVHGEMVNIYIEKDGQYLA